MLKSCGCGLIGQTAEIAPADKKIYALRDVTATVESPNLICASIMSKKLAEGIDGLVLDVKTGSGAFMKTEKDSVHLAELMVETGERMGKKMVALITDMDQPLGLKVGNALEVEECIEVMNGGGPPICAKFLVELAAWMFYLAAHAKPGRGPRAGRQTHLATIPRSRSFARSSATRAATRAPLTIRALAPRSIRRKSSVQPAASWSPFNASRWELPA
jgi:thymidine phosphorylase